jgi:hypothetical protein
VEPDDPAGADRAAEPEAAAAGSAETLAGEEGVARYDPRELRRLVEVSFSAGELSKFAERFGVLLDREGPLDRSARTLVRAREARDQLPELVDALRLAKPLVEWPEPSLVPVPAPPPPPSSAPAAPSSERNRPPSPAARAALVDPFLEQQLGGDEEDRWPAWTRWTILATVLAGGVGVGIAVTYIATRDDTPAPAASGEGPGIASLAAAHLRETVQAVTEACEVAPEDTARDTLTTAFRRCALPPMRPGAVNVPLPTRTPPPSGGAEPPARRQTPAPPRSAACLDECHASYNGCQQSECGGEPSSINEYDAYQRCMSGCMSKYSRCRLTCR